MAPTGRYHGNCLFAPLNPILSVTRAPQLEVGLEKGMATHFGIRAWRIPWTEEPGGLQSRGHKESDS